MPATVEEDTQPRQVTVPPDLQQALADDPVVQAFFEKLAYTHQKEYVQWIEDAKQLRSRQSRIAKTAELLRQGMREHR